MLNISNFTFLKGKFPKLAELAGLAESYFHKDPASAVIKLRIFGERLTDWLISEHRVYVRKLDNQETRIYTLVSEDAIAPSVATLLHILRKTGNVGGHLHAHRVSTQDVENALDAAFQLAKWFYLDYTDEPDWSVDKKSLVLPKKWDAVQTIVELEQQKKDLEARFFELEAQFALELAEKAQRQEENTALQQFQARRQKKLQQIELNEAQTRVFIDEQLQNAGWEADSVRFNAKTGKTLPQIGRFLAIAEWSCGRLYADYALFDGLKLVALVEAKKINTDAKDALEQVKKYGRVVTDKNATLLGKWADYKVPFLFSTNGRPYNPQILSKSGIWFLDTRQPNPHARALQAWYSPQGLRDLLGQNVGVGNQNLQAQEMDYLTDKRGLSLRPYQLKAIQAVENQIFIADNGGHQKALLAMATGTGKTRTMVGLCYRLVKANRFRRILFLVDRTLLGTQAKTAFEENPIEQAQTFAHIYNIAGFEKNNDAFDKLLKAQGKADDSTRIYFSTVQGMVKRIFGNPNPKDIPPVHAYDCIIVDEAHRGYLLDKELDDNTLSFRDPTDFVSKYKAVLDYFDAFRIGLTATPALHTSQIFGFPLFTYSYRQAVLEGFLMDHEPPFSILTQLNTEGIKWEKGQKPQLVQSDGTLIDLACLDDELKIDVDGFNKKVVTIPFNETVCAELVNHLDMDSLQKTLIFAVDNAHADILVETLKKAFQDRGIDVEAEAIVKITGSVPDNQTLTRHFQNERLPNIVITVDLLTTGVDIPKICNLVFIRRVNSRILYEQMKGRATRLCPEIGKESFRIFDAVRLHEVLDEFSEMKPVVQNPTQSIPNLLPELAVADNEAGFKVIQEEIIAKMHRKRQIMDEDAQKVFAKIAKGHSPQSFIETFAQLTPQTATPFIEQFLTAFQFLESLSRQRQEGKLYSEHPDFHLDTVQLFDDKHARPEDYLEKCRQHLMLQLNQNMALTLVATRPQTLTRADLKQLRADLDAAGFTLTRLKSAWKQAKSNEMVTDLIAMIRSLTLGETLQPKEQRIANAMNKIRATQKWSSTQLGWLDRIENRLKLEEPLIDPSFLDEDHILKQSGGFKRMDSLFDKKAAALLRQINEEMYSISA